MSRIDKSYINLDEDNCSNSTSRPFQVLKCVRFGKHGMVENVGDDVMELQADALPDLGVLHPAGFLGKFYIFKAAVTPTSSGSPS